MKYYPSTWIRLTKYGWRTKNEIKSLNKAIKEQKEAEQRDRNRGYSWTPGGGKI